MGSYDQADPSVTSRLGDTPGPLGLNDHADPTLPKLTAATTATAVRLPDGTPIALGRDAKRDELQSAASTEDVFIDPNYTDITSSVGDGFCVALVQLNAKCGTKSLPNTSKWKALTSIELSSKPKLTAGTVIATFNAEGRYESKAEGNHAAFFVKFDTQDGKDGIVIYDQYRLWPHKQDRKIKELQNKIAVLERSAPSSTQATNELAALKRELTTEMEAEKREFPEVDNKGRRFGRKQPGTRFIKFDHAGSPSNNASAFSVVTD